jgi:hypothetical protein
VAVVVAIGAVAYFALRGTSGRHTAASAAETGPASPRAATPTPLPSPSLGPWGHIATRTADPLPLTAPELFPVSFTTAGAAYQLIVSRAGSSCPAAVIGSGLQKAVRQAGCSQVLRASYLSAGRKLMGTIGVLNLQTFTGAEQAGKTASGAQFIAQLPAAKGPAKKLGDGTGIEEAVAKGHYLILVWGEFTSLRAPRTGAQRAALEAFLSDLVSNTANLTLSTRMVDGDPQHGGLQGPQAGGTRTRRVTKARSASSASGG